jgi:hypothetical protein
VNPTVEQTLKKIHALSGTKKIVSLREQANEILQSATDVTSEQQKRVQEILHQPTIDIRKGKNVDVGDVLDHIRIILATPVGK